MFHALPPGLAIAAIAIGVSAVLTMKAFRERDAARRALETQVSERMRQLAASKARLETLVLASAELFWSADPSGQVIAPSASWGVFTGQSNEEQLGEGWLDAVHPDDRDRVRAQWRDSVEAGRMFQTEYRLRSVASGGWRWMASRAAPPLTESGSVREWVGMNEDITERKTAEEANRMQADQYATFLASTSDGFWLLDGDGQLLDVNSAYCRMSGYDRGELLSLKAGDLDCRNRMEYYMEEIVRKDFNHFETRHRKKDGSIIDVEVNAVYWKPSNEIVAFIRDISDRKHAELALRKSEEKLREAQEIGELGSWELDLATNAVEWSREGSRMLGRDPRLPPPRFAEFLDLAHPDDRDKLRRLAEDLVETGTPARIECRILRPDGEERVLEIRGRRHEDARGEPVHLTGVVHDITRLTRAQDELRQHKDHLEELVEQRTTELATANEKLRAANKEMEAFSYSVSHDLRVPLRAINGFSRILTEDYGDKLDAEGLRIINIIQENTVRMGELIDDILAFSRVSRAELTIGEIDMNALVCAVLRALEPSLKERRLTFDVKDLPTAAGDSNTLQRVWTNLIENAVKYTAPKPEAHIEIGARLDRSGTIYYVKDNGVGFDMKHVDRLFGVFQRLHGSEFGGSGIGLAIVKRIVDRHGGKTWAEGKVDEGAIFYFNLPSGKVPSA